jgi:hypothetical protein
MALETSEKVSAEDLMGLQPPVQHVSVVVLPKTTMESSDVEFSVSALGRAISLSFRLMNSTLNAPL